MIRQVSKFAAMLMGIAALPVPAVAHHAFSAEFDIRKPIHLNGVVTEVEFVNPHAWLHVAVRGEGGKAEEWLIESGSPNRLRGRGITRLSIAPGTQVVVDGYAAKDGSRKGSGQELTLADGRRLFISGTRPRP